MRLLSPFHKIAAASLPKLCAALLLVSLALAAALYQVGKPVDRQLAYGIINVEIPWNTEGAAQVRKELGEAGIEAARLHTGIDFAFLIFYPLALSMLCLLAPPSDNPLLRKAALAMSWAVLFAMPLDAIENACVLRLLASDPPAPWPELSSTLAVLKFLLVGAALLFIAVALILRYKQLGWWLAKLIVLLRLNVFTLVSLLIGIYFFGFSQAARELWEDLIGTGSWPTVLVTVVACLAWLGSLVWAPQHAQLAFLDDVRSRHGAEWPTGGTAQQHDRVRRFMRSTPALACVLALASVLFGAVTYTVAEGNKPGPLLTLALLGACAVGIVTEGRWRKRAPEERRHRSRRLIAWQCVLGLFLGALVLRLEDLGELGWREFVRILLPAAAPTALACLSAWWLGRQQHLTLARVAVAGAIRCGVSAAVVLALFEGAADTAPLSVLVMVLAVLALEALYCVVRDHSVFDRLCDSSVAVYLTPEHTSRGSLKALLPVGVGTLLFAMWPVAVGSWLGSLAVTMLALAAWTMLCAVVFIALPTRLGLGAVPMAMPLWFLLASPLSDNHGMPDVRAFDPPSTPTATSEPVPIAASPRRHDLRIGDDFEAWMASPRRSRSNDAPVILVAASGGGIRAAYWTAMTLARLDDRTCGEFGRQTYAISGVSGGSVGAAVYVAAVDHVSRSGRGERSCPLGPDDAGPVEKLVHRFFQQDLMAPLLGSLLFPDAVQRFFPAIIPWGDRARALEQAMEQGWARAAEGSKRFEQPMMAMYEDDRERALPLLVFNSTNVADGRRVQASPILLDDRQAYPLFANDVRTKGLRLSTAAHNSARFPVMSPPASVLARDGKTTMRLVDGGYFENSAAAGASSIYRTLRSAGALGTRAIAVMVIENDPQLDEPAVSCGLEGEQLATQWGELGTPPKVSRNPVPLPSESPGVSPWFFELTSISDALLNARTARAPWHQQELAMLACDHRQHVFRGFFYRNGVNDPLKHADRHDAGQQRNRPDPALSWALSVATRERMDQLVHSGVQRALSGRFGTWEAWPDKVPVTKWAPAP